MVECDLLLMLASKGEGGREGGRRACSVRGSCRNDGDASLATVDSGPRASKGPTKRPATRFSDA